MPHIHENDVNPYECDLEMLQHGLVTVKYFFIGKDMYAIGWMKHTLWCFFSHTFWLNKSLEY